MKIVFLNTWHGKLRDELGSYVQQQLIDTDIFCFQEAQAYDREPYEDLLSNFTLFYTEKSRPQETGSYGNALYVRPGIEVINSGTLFVEDEEAGLAIYVTVKDGEQALTICNVHGVPRPGDKLDTEVRLRQSNALIAHFSDQHRTVIGGDFNLLPETTSVKAFEMNGYQNLIRNYDIKTTRNQITYELYPDNIQYYADYVFVSPSVQVEDFIVPSQVVSDHQPLEVTLS